MSITNSLAVERWRDQILGARETRSMEGGTIFAERGPDGFASTIYSYGRHFPMAEVIRERERPLFVLVNADRYSPTTSRHQSCVRSALRCVSLPVLLVPFSALDAAGILHESIRPAQILPGRWTTTYRKLSRGEIERRAFDHGDIRAAGAPTRKAPVRPYGEHRHDADGRVVWTPVSPETMAEYETAEREHRRARLADIAAADAFEYYDHRSSGGDWGPIERDGDGRYLYPVYRHWLGESVFTARVSERVRRKATASERARYDAAESYWERWRSLRVYLRDATPPADAGPEYAAAWRADHERAARDFAPPKAIDAPQYPDGVARSGDRYTVDRQRKRAARFVSAFDHNESREVYFLAELPRDSRAESVDDALDDLAPGIVKQALARDIDVMRQGDIFAIPCTLPASMTNPAPWRRTASHDACKLVGTDHTASEVIRGDDGVTYARGIMRHEPSGRRRGTSDHARIKLDGWHVIVRNTVPRSR